MTRQQILKAAGGLVLASLVTTVVLAGPLDAFDLGWHVIPGGGGRSSSTDFALDGSAGQSMAGELSSADYRLGAGFWSGTGPGAPAPPPTGSPTPTSSATPTVTGSPSPTATPTPTPTSTPPATCQELLVNGDFETGSLDPWGHWFDVGLGQGHNSAHGAWLGGTDNAQGELVQGAPIPAEATSVDLAFWWLAESASGQPGDAVDVLIQYGAEQGDVLLTLRAEEPLGQWRPEMIDLSAYAGMEVGLTFMVRTDGDVPTTFRVDDVSLEACGVTPSPPTGARLYLPMVMKGGPGS